MKEAVKSCATVQLPDIFFENPGNTQGSTPSD